MAETTSTNTDVMELARRGAPEGLVIAADHQTAGRGRGDRRWSAPPGSSLLASILLRPPASVAALSTACVAVAAAEAVTSVCGFTPRLKWPNDLVWPGDGTALDRKLAGILAEADWASRGASEGQVAADGEVAVVVGIGLNVNWPDELPPELAHVAVACNHVTGRDHDRRELLGSLLDRLEAWYGPLASSGQPAALLDEWRTRSATLGTVVRVERPDGDVVGTAADITDRGELVVDTGASAPVIVAVGDVIHLRPA